MAQGKAPNRQRILHETHQTQSGYEHVTKEVLNTKPFIRIGASLICLVNPLIIF